LSFIKLRVVLQYGILRVDYKIITKAMSVNTESLDKKVWLVKIPKFIADKWSNTEEGAELGKVRIYAGKEAKVTLHVTDADLPKNYALRFTNTSPKNEYVFSEAAISGRVHHEATVQPIIDDDYRKIMHSRNEESVVNARSIKIMDKVDGKNRQFIVPNLQDNGGFGILVMLTN
jgi:transcription initiation factor TFIIF subunit beta